MKSTKKSTEGTSFHGDVFFASVNQLICIIGDPYYACNDGSDKTNYDWQMELEDGDVFTIYDWKYYRPLSPEEIIEWHVGGFNSSITKKAVIEINKLLK